MHEKLLEVSSVVATMLPSGCCMLPAFDVWATLLPEVQHVQLSGNNISVAGNNFFVAGNR